MRYLLTQSLLGAWEYMFSCHEDFLEKAKDDFFITLRHEHKETTPEMQNGIDFENLCYEIAAGLYRPTVTPTGAIRAMGDTIITEERSYHKWHTGASAVATVIKGSQFQVKASRELTTANGMEILVYGILDALRAGSIFDVKFLNKSFGSADLVGKYMYSPQHPTYFYLVPEALDFTYLVSDGQDLYTERYTPEDTQPLQEIVDDFFSFLEEMKLMDIYKENWVAK